MPNNDRNDPYRSYNFSIEINGKESGAFSEVTGLTADGDAVDYREGADMRHNVRKLIGLRKFTNLTLKRGYTQDLSLWNWYRNILNGQPDRRDVTIVLKNEKREPVLRWQVDDAWINKIEGPAFKASGNEVAMESVELVHEGLTLEVA
jgi:phage tail-like protein